MDDFQTPAEVEAPAQVEGEADSEGSRTHTQDVDAHPSPSVKLMEAEQASPDEFEHLGTDMFTDPALLREIERAAPGGSDKAEGNQVSEASDTEPFNLDCSQMTEDERESFVAQCDLLGALAESTSGADRAWVLEDLATVEGLLGETESGLAHARDAHRAAPKNLGIARSFHLAALRAGSGEDLVLSMAGEAHCSNDVDKDVLLVERARVLAQLDGEEKSAADAYRSLCSGSQGLAASLGLEALQVRNQDWAEAASAAALAAGASTLGLKAELHARAARHLSRAGDHAEAMSEIERALAVAPLTATTAATIERIAGRAGGLARLTHVREWLLDLGGEDELALLVDLGLLARYRLGNPKLAREIFERLASSEDASAQKLALDELLEIYEASASWSELAETIESLAALTHEVEHKADLLAQLGDLWAVQLGDPLAAVAAFQRAIELVPDCGRALQGAGRIYRQQANRDALIAMHRAELGSAEGAIARCEPAKRLGELLVEDPDALEEGIQLLQEALPHTRSQQAVFACLERALRVSEDWTALIDLYRSGAKSGDIRRRATYLEQAAHIASDRLGDHDTAIRILKEIESAEIAAVPLHLIKLRSLLRTAEDWSGLAELLRGLDKGYGEQIDRPHLLAELAEACERSGDADGAAAAYRLACHIATDEHPVLQAAGRFFLDRGEYKELASLYETFAERGNAESKVFWLTRAAVVLADYLGEREKAIRLLQRAVASGDTRALPTLARMLSVDSRWQELAELDAAHDLGLSLTHRGAIHEAVGDTQTALRLYGQAHESGDGHIQCALDRLRVEEGDWVSLAAPNESATRHQLLLAAGVARDELSDHELSQEITESIPAGDLVGLSISLWQLEKGTEPAFQAQILANAPSWELDEPALGHFQYSLATILSEGGDEKSALILWMRLLREQGWDPVTSAHVDNALRQYQQLKPLVQVLRLGMAGRPSAALTAITASRLGELYSQLGLSVEAHRSWQQAVTVSEGAVRLRALLGLAVSLSRRGDRAGHREVLAEIGNRVPVNWLQATCHWLRGCSLMEDRDDPGAEQAFVRALEVQPGHLPSLSTLARLLERDERNAEIVAPLTRAFESPLPPADFIEVGRCLATLLVREERLETALAVVERLFSHSSSIPSVGALLCEIHYRLGHHKRAAELAHSLSTREDVGIELRSGAARRYAELVGGDSENEQRRAWLTLVGKQGQTPWVHLHDLVEIHCDCGEPKKAAVLLDKIIDDSEGRVRAHYLWRQSKLYEGMGESSKAMESLSKLEHSGDPNPLVELLLTLANDEADRTQSVLALENALDQSADGIEPALELRVRNWLANALLSVEENSKDAIPHLERIISLDPEDISAMEMLALLAAESQLDRAALYHAALLVKQPERTELYRPIHTFCVDSGDVDGAFLVEAVLAGLGTATEEDEYFYRQRRAQLGPGVPATDALDLQSLSPAIEPHLQVILEELEDVANLVLPVDWTSYGLDGSQLPGPGLLDEDFKEVATWLGVGNYKLAAISMETAPAVEQDSNPVILVPGSLASKTKRHRQCVAGAVMARIRFHGVLGAPSSLCAISPRQLDYLLLGAVCLARDEAPPDDNAVFRDIHRRLDLAMGSKSRQRIAEAMKGSEITTGCGPQIIDAMNRSAARGALLFARDPLVAVECFRLYPGLIGDPPGESKLGKSAVESLAFSVSQGHRDLRDALEFGVKRD